MLRRLAVAFVILLGLAGGGYVAGFVLLAETSDRVASLAPANTTAYVNLYLQPSAGQQMNLADLIGRLPGFADEASLDDKIDRVVGNLLGGTGIDYEAEVKPWLGDQLALAAWPADGSTDGASVVIADVKDAEAAAAAAASLVADDGASFTTERYREVELHVAASGAYAFVDGLLVFGPTADALRAIVDVTIGGASLADRSDFRDTMGRIPTDHLGSIFVDVAALAGVEPGGDLGGIRAAAAALVAEPDGLRLTGSAPITGVATAVPADQAGYLADWMPPETLAEVSVTGLHDIVAAVEGAAAGPASGGEILGALDTIRALLALGVGLDLEDDVLPLLDDEVAVALSGLDGTMPTGQVLIRATDAELASDTLDRIVAGLALLGAPPRVEERGDTEVTVVAIPEFGEVAMTLADGVVILGLTVDDVMAAVDAHASGTALGATERYAGSFALAGARGGTEAWVDIGALGPLLGDALVLPDDARDILSAIGTLALTAPSHQDEIEIRAVLTIDER